MRNRVVIIIPSSSIYRENSLIPITWNLEIHNSKISRVKNAKIPVKRREGGDKVSRLRLNSKAPNPPPRSSSGVKMGQKVYLPVTFRRLFIYSRRTHPRFFPHRKWAARPNRGGRGFIIGTCIRCAVSIDSSVSFDSERDVDAVLRVIKHARSPAISQPVTFFSLIFRLSPPPLRVRVR